MPQLFEPSSLGAVKVPIPLIGLLGGDATSAYVISYLYARARQDGYELDGRIWHRVSTRALADELGLTPRQARRSLTRLIDDGLLEAEKHHRGGRQDQTLSYTVICEEQS